MRLEAWVLLSLCMVLKGTERWKLMWIAAKNRDNGKGSSIRQGKGFLLMRMGN